MNVRSLPTFFLRLPTSLGLALAAMVVVSAPLAAVDNDLGCVQKLGQRSCVYGDRRQQDYHRVAVPKFASSQSLESLRSSTFRVPSPANHTSQQAVLIAQTGGVPDTLASPAVVVNHAAAFGTSPPLRDLAKLPFPSQRVIREASPVRQIPKPHMNQGTSVDPVEQSSAGSAPNYFAVTPLNFAQGDARDIVASPDSDIAVGDAQIVQWGNASYAVFDKKGNLQGRIPSGVVWSNLGGPCADPNRNASGPIARFDQTSHRWLLAQNVVRFPYAVCIAVSTTEDATGSYYLYQFPVVEGGLPDYSKWGIWSTGYFQTWNNFSPSGGFFEGAVLCGYNSAKLLAGDATAERICHQYTNSDDSLLPADQDSLDAPPAGEDEFAVGSLGAIDNSHLSLYSMHVDSWEAGAATFTGDNNSQLISIASFTPACSALNTGVCAAVNAKADTLDPLADRLMSRFAYYNDKVAQHWYISFDVTASNGQGGVRWMELTAPNRNVAISNLSIAQQSTFAPDSNGRRMGSIARDQAGNILVGYQESGAKTSPSMFIAGRTLVDAPGTLQNEVSVSGSPGSQAGNAKKVGSHSALRIDPADNCTFWLWYGGDYGPIQMVNGNGLIAAAMFSNCSGLSGAQTRPVAFSNPSRVTDSESTPQQLATLYSNLGTGSSVYQPSSGWLVSGIFSGQGSNSYANEFQLTAGGSVSEIDLGVGYITTGGTFFNAAIYADNNGIPGALLGMWSDLSSSQQFPGCCNLVSIPVSGLNLCPGTNYWAVTSAFVSSNTYVYWNYSNSATGLEDYSSDGGNTWVQQGTQPQGALQILGTNQISTTNLTSSLNPSSVNVPVTLTATVSGDFGTPTGKVTFTSDNNPIPECPSPVNLFNGVATCTTQSLPAGTHNINASYSGNCTYAASNGSLKPPQKVTIGASKTALQSSKNPSNVNDSVTFTAAVTAVNQGPLSPTGTVSFTDNGTAIPGCSAVPLVSGVATCATQSLTAGTHAIIASYSGDMNFSSSNNNLTQTVNMGASNTALQSSKNPSNVNDSVTFTAAVTAVNHGPLSPTGTVSFTDNGTAIPGCSAVPLVSGVATCATQSLTAGTHAIIASYSGDMNFSSSNNNLTQMVNPIASKTVLQSSSNPSIVNAPVTFTATVTASSPGGLSPTGTVTFTSNSAAIPECPNPVQLVSGVGTCTTKSLPAGSDLIKASYGGDNNFGPSSGQLTQTVTQSASAPVCGSLLLQEDPQSKSSLSVLAGVTCTDPQNEVLTTTIDWGDGNKDTVSGGSLTSFPHTYTQASKYSLVVTATDTSGLQGYAYAFLNLLPQPPQSVFAGQTATEMGVPVTSQISLPVTFTCIQIRDSGGNLKLASDLGITCNSVPTQVTLSAGQTPVTIEIHTMGSASGALNRGMKHRTWLYAFVLPSWPLILLSVGFGAARRRRGALRCTALAAVLVLLCLVMSCGGGFTPPKQAPPPSGTPADSYQVYVVDEPAGSATGFAQQTLIVPLTVSQPQ